MLVYEIQTFYARVVVEIGAGVAAPPSQGPNELRWHSM